MADLNIQKVNEVYLQVKTEPHIEYELRDRFTFEVPNKKFMPQYRSKYWDGYVHLFNMKTKSNSRIAKRTSNQMNLTKRHSEMRKWTK